MTARRPRVPCPICGTIIRTLANKTCSRPCLLIYKALNRDPVIEAERRRKISERMKIVRTEIPNPMEDPEVRARMAATLRAVGHQPQVKGGNGRGPTECEALLFGALTLVSDPGTWQLNYIDPNGVGSRDRGEPTHYKIDIAWPAGRIAVEVDGPSHRCRKDEDHRKNVVLGSRGWRVIRITNQRVHDDLAGAVAEVLRWMS